MTTYATRGCFACGAWDAPIKQLDKAVTLHAACYPGLSNRSFTPGLVAVCARCEEEISLAQGVKFVTVPTGPRGLAAWLGETFVREQLDRGKVWMRVQMPGGLAVDQMGDPESYPLQPGERVIWTDSCGRPRMRGDVRDFRAPARETFQRVAQAPPGPKSAPAPAQRPWVTQELPRRCPTCRGKYTGTFARCPQCGRPREEPAK